MSFRHLAAFLEDLATADLLARVKTPVEPGPELAQAVVEELAGPNRALLFGNVGGQDLPVLANLLGSDLRICRALGAASLDEAAARLEAQLVPARPDGWFDRLKGVSAGATLTSAAPKTIRSGPAQQVVLVGKDVDLNALPALRCRSEEQEPAITAGILLTSDPDTGARIVGRFDLSVVEPSRLAIHWGAHEPIVRLLEAHTRLSRPMPVAVILGGPPVLLLAAMAPLPEAVDVLAVAGLLGEKPIELVACRSVPLEAPAEADLVLEGTIDPSAPLVAVGPRATPLGHCTPASRAPVIDVSTVTRRANPIFPTLVHGPGACEWVVLRRAMHRLFLLLLRQAVPGLVDCNLPVHGSARHTAFVSIRKTHVGQAARTAHALWGLAQTMFTKLLVIVDEEVDVHDEPAVWAAVASRMNPARDVLVQPGPNDPWDPATPPGQPTPKMALDATTKLPGEASITKC